MYQIFRDLLADTANLATVIGGVTALWLWLLRRRRSSK